MPDPSLDLQESNEKDAGHWRVVIDIDRVTLLPQPAVVVEVFAGELLDFLADRLQTTGGTSLEWVLDA